jgi:hypothetical protein
MGDVGLWELDLEVELGVDRGAFYFWKVLVSVRNLNGAYGFAVFSSHGIQNVKC